MSEIRRAIVKSYDAAAHKAAVQIAGSLAVWLNAVRVATNIPPADVVTGRQCTVLFLDPSNQDDAVIIAVQGALPSVGEILVATATANLTLTTTAQSITGDGDGSKVRLLLPTPGDWLIEVTCDFVISATGTDGLIGEVEVDDSGSAESGFAILDDKGNNIGATISQRWKVTTTAADTPVELKARKATAAGTGIAFATHTRIAATGVKRSTGGGGVTDHGALTGLSDDDHTQYGALAQAETWAGLQTFNAGLRLAASQVIEDSGGTGRILLATSSPHITLTGDIDINSGFLAIGNAASISTLAPVNIVHDYTLGSFGFGYGINANITDQGAGGVIAIGLIGLTGSVENKRSAGTIFGVEGLFFQATHNPTSATTTVDLRGARLRTLIQASVGAVTTVTGLGIVMDSAASAVAPTTAYAVKPLYTWAGNNPGTLYGYYAPALPTATVAAYHAWWGGATPNFRVDGGNPPDAALATEGDSPLWLVWMENGTLTSRRVRWRQQSSLGATDKVLIAA